MAALLALHAWLAVSATIDLGVTGDETVHLTGGYSYWRFNDYRFHPENGNLSQRWAALPLLISKPRLEPRDWPADWKNSDVWMAGQHFFFESGNNIDYLLLCARTTMVFWSVATGLLVFFWARALWDDAGGLFSLGLYVLSPTALAHGPLVTSDMFATFWLLTATAAWWRVTEKVDAGRLGLSLATVAVASVAKFSCLLLLPIAALIVVWRIFQPRPIAVNVGRDRCDRQVISTAGKLSLFGSVAALHLLTAAVVIWACFGFRYSAFASDLPRASDFFSSFDQMLPSSGCTRWLLVNARHYRVLPEAFLQGLVYVFYAARERPAFLAGEYASTGWWWFFPFAFVVKSSIAELLTCLSLIVWVVIHWLREGRRILLRAEPLVPLLVFGLVYGTASLSSHLNIGQRHILPLYPILFIFAGALAQAARGISSETVSATSRAGDVDPAAMRGSAGMIGHRRIYHAQNPAAIGAALVAIIIGIAVAETYSIRSNYLSFFNQLAGGPKNGWRLLGDSSLDWGQNLPQLGTWLDEHRQPDESVYLSYFGADDPFYRGIKAVELAPYYSFGRERCWDELHGGIYCVSASMLQDASSPYRGTWTSTSEAGYQGLARRVHEGLRTETRPRIITSGAFTDLELWNLERARFARLAQVLRVRKPDAVIGHSVFIYRLTDADIRRATASSLAELAALILESSGRPFGQGN